MKSFITCSFTWSFCLLIFLRWNIIDHNLDLFLSCSVPIYFFSMLPLWGKYWRHGLLLLLCQPEYYWLLKQRVLCSWFRNLNNKTSICKQIQLDFYKEPSVKRLPPVMWLVIKALKLFSVVNKTTINLPAILSGRSHLVLMRAYIYVVITHIVVTQNFISTCW